MFDLFALSEKRGKNFQYKIGVKPKTMYNPVASQTSN